MQILKGSGFLKPNFLKESMKLNWNFQRGRGGGWRWGGGGVHEKKTSFVGGGGVKIFSGRTQNFLIKG